MGAKTKAELESELEQKDNEICALEKERAELADALTASEDALEKAYFLPQETKEAVVNVASREISHDIRAIRNIREQPERYATPDEMVSRLADDIVRLLPAFDLTEDWYECPQDLVPVWDADVAKHPDYASVKSNVAHEEFMSL